MPMYRERPALKSSHDLDQGDILGGLLVPRAPTKKNLALVRNKNKMDWPAPAASLKKLDKELRAVCPIERLDYAIVVSNSCDNAGNYPILLAPIREFKFAQGELSEAEKWMNISEAATGTASPKLFYLPGSNEHGLPRSEALLPNLFSLQHTFLQRCIDEADVRRVCGLTSEAQRHLQWAIGLLFSRDPRDDDAWPSVDDLRLKLAWLEEEIPRAGHRREALEAEREKLKELVGPAVAEGDS